MREVPEEPVAQAVTADFPAQVQAKLHANMPACQLLHANMAYVYLTDKAFLSSLCALHALWLGIAPESAASCLAHLLHAQILPMSTSRSSLALTQQRCS